MNSLRIPLSVLLLIFNAAAGIPAAAELLYETDFEGFNVGPDQWVGSEGWSGDNVGFGAHGIDLDAIQDGGLGKTAFIGYTQPESRLVSVFKPFDYSPGPSDHPVVTIDTIIGINDSVTRTQRDSFFVSILNSDGDFLAAIHFANQPTSYGIWREDGVLVHDLDFLFFRGELHHLYLTIDLPANRWSAELDGTPLFDNAVFTATAHPVNFGSLAYEWQLTAQSPGGYGDNWMLVADAIVRSSARPIFEMTLRGESGFAIMSWPAEAGCDYQVDYTSDFEDWFSDLSGSSFPGITENQVLSFSESIDESHCYYRIRKSYTP